MSGYQFGDFTKSLLGFSKEDPNEKVYKSDAASFQELKSMGQRTFQDLVNLQTDRKYKWESLGTEDSIEISRASLENNSIYVMRGDGSITCSPQKIVETLADIKARSVWDSLFLSRDIVDMIEDNGDGNRLFSSHMKFKPPSAVIYPRDFFTLTGSKYDKDTGKALFFARSIKHEKVPDSEGYVRAQLLTSGYIITPNQDKTQCKVTYIVQLDPKGWIPPGLANIVAKQQPLTLAKLRDYIAKN